MKYNSINEKILAVLKYSKRKIEDIIGALIVKSMFRYHTKSLSNYHLDIPNSDDITQIVSIYKSSFNSQNPKGIINYCKMFRKITYVLKQKDSNKTVLGYCICYLHLILNNHHAVREATIYSIAIKSDERKKGYGKELLSHVISQLRANDVKRIRLFVDKENMNAYSLYLSLGFKVISEINNICGENKICYMMILES